MKRATPPRLLIALMTVAALAGCGNPGPAKPANSGQAPPAAPAQTVGSMRFHDPQADGTLRQQRSDFQGAIAGLLKQPDDKTLAAAQQSWSALYRTFNVHYLRLAERACALNRPDLLARLDSWPFYPAYVDALPAWPDSGIVNDPTLNLSAEVLRQQQGVTDDGEIALGFQPLWLLIAGVEAAPRQPRQLLAAVNENIERRRTYVKLAAAQLEDDLSVLGTETDETVDTARCALSALDDRLDALAASRDSTDPANGLYVSAHSLAIVDKTQPSSALQQLASDDNAPLRGALEKAWPGFQAALAKAVRTGKWDTLGEWLKPSDEQALQSGEGGD